MGLQARNDQTYLVKRVIGLPGDTVTCCDTAGRMKVNGVSIDETYLRAGNTPSSVAFTMTVPPGFLVVLGDNRAISADSRFHQTDPGGGKVPIDHVIGKVVAVAAPISRFGVLAGPGAVYSRVPSPRP
jgi:signal peptidase I